MAALCVYRARYFNTVSAPPHGRFTWATHSVRTTSESSASKRSDSASAASSPGKRSRPALEGSAEPGEELAPEHAAEDADGEKVVGAAGDPTALVRREPAAGDDAMDMGVQREVLTPGMQHREHADLGTQVPGVGGHFEEGFRGGPHEQAVHLTRVVQRDRTESTGEREGDVEVRCVEQVGGLGFQPSRGGRGLALGAMAIATRVVGHFLVPALRALQDVSTQGGGAAGSQVVEGAALHGRQARTVLLQERVVTAPDDLGHFEPRSGHGWVSLRGESLSSSNGLRVDWRAAVATWR